MSDIGAVALAVVVWIGALAAPAVPRSIGLIAVVVALVLRRPALLVVAALLLSCGLSRAAWAGLVPPMPSSVASNATLVSDPVEVGHALHVALRIGDRRVDAWARGPASAALRDRLAGEVVEVSGRLQPPGAARERLAVRHIAARLDVTTVGRWRHGSMAATAANVVRRLLLRGSSSLAPDRRALLSGFLLGDVRDIPATIEADFRAAGLTHLLAVSGQNLAFLLAVAGPLLRRMQLRGRLCTTLGLIAFFAVLTRAEPSVLRASAMAAIACWAAFAGRPTSRLRVLSLAVAALVLVDPMLTRSVGFQLSVGASVGLALLASPIASRLSGPRWLAESLGVTIAAQAGVAPVLLTTFGGMPLVTPVANLFAVPVAGPLTAWGLTGGLVAGVFGAPVATVLHAPTNLMVGWIEAVARASAGAPVGLVTGRDLAIAFVVAAAVIRFRRLVVPLVVTVLVVLARPAVGQVAGDEVGRGAHLWRSAGTVLVIDGPTDSARLLDGLRRAGVRRIDLVVARRGSKDVAAVLLDLRERLWIRSIAAPLGNRIRDATTVPKPTTMRVGHLVVRLEPRGGALDVHI